MHDLNPGYSSVDDLAEEFAQRWREGEKPSVEEYMERHPDLAEEIREVFPAVLMMEQLKPRREDTPVSPLTTPFRDATPLDRLDEYRMVREIGRGGMGIVYEAVQEPLGRRVAIKVLPAHLFANEKLRQRFRREAQAAARLHHTNIVPVFNVGETQGLCYYVMQLIAGRGLDVVLREGGTLRERQGSESTPQEQEDPGSTARLSDGADSLPASSPLRRRVTQTGTPTRDRPPLVSLPATSQDYARAVARVGVQVAEALEYAHAQGILHRDIKPSNLLLDEREAVWVTDFGVAKLVEEANLTQSGDLVGTLKYMPPERFSGVSEARGDVYSLGITLYEMIAQQSAFPDTTPQHLIQLITHAEPPALRTINAGVPADLETIILKAIARDPTLRYQTAGEMAEDLRRFLDDRPIRARRTSALNYLWRWCRRNPLAANLAVMVLTLLVVVSVVSVVAYVRTAAANREVAEANGEIIKANEEITRANQEITKALNAEQMHREQAEMTSAEALEALNRIYDRFAPNRIVVSPQVPVEGSNGETIEVPITPVLSREAAPLLSELLVFYERLAQRGGDYPQLRIEAAEANHRIGDIRQRLGQFDTALLAYQRAIALYQQLQVESPENSALKVKLARSYNELGRVHWARQALEKEREAHALAVATLADAPVELVKRPEYRYELARTYYFQARREPSPQGQGPPGPGWPLPGLGRPADRSGGHGRGGSGRSDRYRDSSPFQKATSLLKDLVKEYPGVPDYRHLLACCYRDAPPERLSRGPQWGSASFEKAVEILRDLAKGYPDVPDYRYDLSETLARPEIPRFPFSPDTITRAKTRLEEAMSLAKQLVAEYPKVPHYVAGYAQLHERMGILLLQMKKVDEAEKLLRQGVALQKEVVSQYPQIAGHAMRLSQMQSSLAIVLIERREWKEARALLQESIARQQTVLKNEQQMGFLRVGLGRSYRTLADVFTRLGDKVSAAEALRHAEDLGGRRPPPFAGRPEGNGRRD